MSSPFCNVLARSDQPIQVSTLFRNERRPHKVEVTGHLIQSDATTDRLKFRHGKGPAVLTQVVQDLSFNFEIAPRPD